MTRTAPPRRPAAEPAGCAASAAPVLDRARHVWDTRGDWGFFAMLPLGIAYGGLVVLDEVIRERAARRRRPTPLGVLAPRRVEWNGTRWADAP